MPDYPYVYDSRAPRPIGLGGTRLRVFRRRPPAEGTEHEENSGSAEESDARWRQLLGQAVEELNESFGHSGVPFLCSLDEDEGGFSLKISRIPGPGETAGAEDAPEGVEEAVEPADLPRWLARLRARLGILVDEKA
jgi:hypothetical protein